MEIFGSPLQRRRALAAEISLRLRRHTPAQSPIPTSERRNIKTQVAAQTLSDSRRFGHG
jgi:hypothetical protein